MRAQIQTNKLWGHVAHESKAVTDIELGITNTLDVKT